MPLKGQELWNGLVKLIDAGNNGFVGFPLVYLTPLHPQVPEIWGEEFPPVGEMAKMERDGCHYGGESVAMALKC